MKILDGKACAADIRAELTNRVNELALHPCLAIVTVGDDPASATYVRNKKKAADEIGIRVQHVVLAHDASQQDVIKAIRALNYDPLVHGIIVQLPLPEHIDKEAVQKEIWNCKDVDGFKSESPYPPCTPAGIMWLLLHNNILVFGKRVVICGRSDIVGKPLAQMMLNANATVTVCHSKTPATIRIDYLSNADVIVSAVGIPNFIKPDDILSYDPTTNDIYSNHPILIDVGINRDENGKICGDISPECYNAASAYTPVPGGIGPMTVAMLMKHVVWACEKATDTEGE